MTPQEIFDTAVGGVLKQGHPSVAADGSCVYRDPDGAKCAAGFLLTDEEASGCEGHTIDNVCPVRLEAHVILLLRLQDAHDRAADWCSPEDFPEEFARRARQVAMERYLSATVIDQWEAER